MSQITVTKMHEDAASRALQVTVAEDRVRQAEDRAVKLYAARAKFPGFRPGKAPATVVRKRFAEAIRQSVLEEVIRESWETAQTSENLKPIADPSIRNVKFEAGGPIEFELVVEVRPDVKLERLGGFKLTRTVAPVGEAQIGEQLERLREQKASWIPLADQPPAPGQMVRVEVTTVADGVTHAPQPHTFVLGEGQAIPQLEEHIMTLRPGETGETDVRFPEDHPDESKRGQSRHLRVTLHEVKRQELPPLDDALAREAGDFDSLEALTAAVRTDLEEAARRDADAKVREQLIQALVEANGVTAPDSLVGRLLQGYAKMYQVPEDRFEQFAQEFRPIAETQVKRDLVLEAVSEAHQLRATEAELDARVARLAEARGAPVREVYASLQKSNRLGELERAITEDKIFAFLLEQSTVDEVTS